MYSYGLTFVYCIGNFLPISYLKSLLWTFCWLYTWFQKWLNPRCVEFTTALVITFSIFFPPNRFYGDAEWLKFMGGASKIGRLWNKSFRSYLYFGTLFGLIEKLLFFYGECWTKTFLTGLNGEMFEGDYEFLWLSTQFWNLVALFLTFIGKTFLIINFGDWTLVFLLHFCFLHWTEFSWYERVEYLFSRILFSIFT